MRRIDWGGRLGIGAAKNPSRDGGAVLDHASVIKIALPADLRRGADPDIADNRDLSFKDADRAICASWNWLS